MQLFDLTLDMRKDPLIPPEIRVRVGEEGTQTVRATFICDGEPYSVPEDATVKLQVKRADGGLVRANATRISDSVYEAIIPSQAFTYHGVSKLAYFAMYEGESLVETSQGFRLIVLPGTTDELAVKYYDEQLNEMVEYIQDFGEEAEKHEAERVSNENTRIANEEARIEAENERASAESVRNELYQEILGKAAEGKLNGATFTPYWEGTTLHFRNDKDLPNPEPEDLKGEKGDTGERGPKGDRGPQGEPGISPDPLGYYDTPEELEQAHNTGNNGDIYLVGKDIYTWDQDKASWVSLGAFQGPKGDGVEKIDVSYCVTDGADPDEWQESAPTPNPGETYWVRIEFVVTSGETKTAVIPVHIPDTVSGMDEQTVNELFGGE